MKENVMYSQLKLPHSLFYTKRWFKEKMTIVCNYSIILGRCMDTLQLQNINGKLVNSDV